MDNDRRGVSRREFLKISGVAAAVIGAGPASAQDTEQKEGAAVLPRYTGEPYALAGKRMMFTSWLYVRPATFT